MKSIVSIILLLICLVFVESGIESVKKIIEKTFHRKNQNYLTNQKNSDFSMNQFFSLRDKKKVGWSLFNRGYGSLGRF
jgi:hypothetical protein